MFSNCRVLDQRRLTVTKALDSDHKIALVIAFHICFMQCKNMLVSTSDVLYNMNSQLNLLAIILIGFVYVRLVFTCKEIRWINKKAFFLLIGIVIWWLISYLADPRLFTDTTFPYSYVRREATTYITYGLPLFILCSYLDDVRPLLSNFYRSAPITFMFSSVAMILYIVNPVNAGDSSGYSMAFGNQMLLSCALIIFRYINEGGRKNLLMFFVTIAYIVIGGSRGSLIGVIVLFVYLCFSIKPQRKRVLFVLAALLVGIVFIFSWKYIFTFLYEFLYSKGINSRSLYMAISGIGFYDSGRSIYHERLLAAVNQSPVLGLGAFGGEKTVGLAHSLYLDILANFGYIVGTIFIAMLVLTICKNLLKRNKNARTQVIIMMSLILFPRGVFDENFWGAWELWVIFGLLLGVKNARRSKNMEIARN